MNNSVAPPRIGGMGKSSGPIKATVGMGKGTYWGWLPGFMSVNFLIILIILEIILDSGLRLCNMLHIVLESFALPG